MIYQIASQPASQPAKEAADQSGASARHNPMPIQSDDTESPRLGALLIDYLPSILLRSALCKSGFSSASRFRSALAQTMKAFMGRLIRWTEAGPLGSTTWPWLWPGW